MYINKERPKVISLEISVYNNPTGANTKPIAVPKIITPNKAIGNKRIFKSKLKPKKSTKANRIIILTPALKRSL